MRAAIYVRVSSRQQVEGDSLEDQLNMCRAYIAQRGWVEAGEYIEPGKSAFTENLDKRVAFQQLRADAKARKFDVVVVYKLNRFARKVIVQYQVAAELERNRVEIASVTQPVDRKTVGGRITFGVLAVLAEAQSDELSAVMRDKWLNAAKRGQHVGPIPCGFDRVDGKLVPNDDRHAVIQAFELYQHPETSCRSVAAELNRMGYTNRGLPFTTSGLQELLKNVVYLGTVRCGDYEHPNAHEAIVPESLFQSVNRRMQQRGTRAISNRVPKIPALLIDIARCSSCGAKMWYQSYSARSPYYRCSSVANGGGCNARMARADSADAIVLATLATLAMPGGWVEHAADEVIRQSKMERPEPSNNVIIEQRIKRLARLYQDGVKSDEEYEGELRALRAQLRFDEPKTIDPQQVINEALALLNDLPTLLAEATPQERRSIVTQCIESVHLKRRSVVAITPVRMLQPFLRAAHAHLNDEQWLNCCVWWAGRASGINHTHFENIRRPILRIAA